MSAPAALVSFPSPATRKWSCIILGVPLPTRSSQNWEQSGTGFFFCFDFFPFPPPGVLGFPTSPLPLPFLHSPRARVNENTAATQAMGTMLRLQSSASSLESELAGIIGSSMSEKSLSELS